MQYSMFQKNKLIIASAGAGKTTYLIDEALKVDKANVLITTYTENNAREIKSKFLELNKYIPNNVTIQPWFSFLLEHGVRPYQGVIFLDEIRITGMKLVNKHSGIKEEANKQRGYPISYSATEPLKYYLSDVNEIYSDKISKFVIECNKQAKDAVIKRLANIYQYIFIDEVQDLSGYDLEIIRLLLQSKAQVLMVGDPRQTTYLTHQPKKHQKYSDGKIKDYLSQLPKKIIPEIDEKTLLYSHRNNQLVCELASKLYPEYPPSKSCECPSWPNSLFNSQDGLFLVEKSNKDAYLEETKAVQLRWDAKIQTSSFFQTLNFGESKGLGFDHVLIYPTKKMIEWLSNSSSILESKTRSKLYVAITRARHSVAFLLECETERLPEKFKIWQNDKTQPNTLMTVETKELELI